MRRFVVPALLALMLVVGLVGGRALASIPSSDGFIHACHTESPSRIEQVVFLDADQAPGTCPASYPSEVKLVGTAGP